MSSEVQIAVIDQQDTQIVLAVPGVQGATGSNLPTGGTANQVLRKASSTNYDTDWSLVTNAMVDGSAAIAGTKISPNFGSQNVVTTGTSTAASFIPTSSSVPTNGVYLPSANNVAISTNGVQRMNIEADGDINIDSGGVFYDATNNRLAIGTTSPSRKLEVSDAGVDNFIRVDSNGATKTGIEFASSATVYSQLYFNNVAPYDLSLLQQYTTGSLIFGTNNTERARIDSSGRLLVGTSTARSNVYSVFSPYLQLEGGSVNGQDMLSITRNQNDIFGPQLILAKSRGTANTIVVSGDLLGTVSMVGNDGSSFIQAARIEAFVDGTPGSNDMPGRLVFSVTADGASSPTEAMRIKNTRVINFSNAPVYADNAAAKTGGLVDGDVYRTSTGDLKIVYT
jgi:hypothetical protein